MQKANYVFVFLIRHVLGPLKTILSACVHACVRARACVCAKMRVSV